MFERRSWRHRSSPHRQAPPSLTGLGSVLYQGYWQGQRLQPGDRILSVDARPSIQARGAAAPPSRPGLARPHPNAIMIHTPVHASWLNQVEIVFSIIQKKVLTPNDFPGTGTLSHALHAFVHRYNRTARPFNWKFTADDLTALLRRISQREQAATSQQPPCPRPPDKLPYEFTVLPTSRRRGFGSVRSLLQKAWASTARDFISLTSGPAHICPAVPRGPADAPHASPGPSRVETATDCPRLDRPAGACSGHQTVRRPGARMRFCAARWSFGADRKMSGSGRTSVHPANEKYRDPVGARPR
jgi:hypothetical protein